MDSIRRSSRAPVPVGTKIETPKSRDIYLLFQDAEECESHLPRPSDPQPFFEKSEKWDSPMAPCYQIALHGRVPSNKPDTKRLTMRGDYVSTRNKENWATTSLPVGTTATTSKPRKQSQDKAQPVSTASRRDSAHPPEHKCGLGDEGELSTRHQSDEEDSSDTSRTLSPTLLDADTPAEDLLAHAEEEAVLALLSLCHTANRPMTREDMRTDIVEHRRSILEKHEGVPSHWDQYGTWVKESKDGKDLRWEKREEKWVKESEGGKGLKWVEQGRKWVEESQERSSLKRERMFEEEEEREGKRRKRMGAMLSAYAEA